MVSCFFDAHVNDFYRIINLQSKTKSCHGQCKLTKGSQKSEWFGPSVSSPHQCLVLDTSPSEDHLSHS
jgi:hypothetical protein